VCPGFVSTPILGKIPAKVLKALEDRVPLGRLARPEEIANTFAFLASDEASYINGAVIEVSGGAHDLSRSWPASRARRLPRAACELEAGALEALAGRMRQGL
jgi:hypothetical protein